MSDISAKMLITVVIEFLTLPLVSFLAAGTVFWFYGWIFWILFSSCYFVRSVDVQAQSRIDNGAFDRVQT